MAEALDTLNGSCLCGACKFTAQPEQKASHICHCGMCRKWSGGMFLAADCGESVVFENEASVGRYNASEWGERVFCKECGSSMLWQTRDGKNQHVSIQAFESPDQFKLESELFIDRKPSNYTIANDTNVFTEAEVFALFASEGGEG